MDGPVAVLCWLVDGKHPRISGVGWQEAKEDGMRCGG